MIPELKGGLNGQASAEECKQPLDEVDLRLYGYFYKSLRKFRHVVLKEGLETSAYCWNKVSLHTEEFPEERVTQDEVAK